MDTTNKDVMQESAQVLGEQADIPDGPNVGPSPQEHLAAKGIAQPPLPAADATPQAPSSAGKACEAGTAAPQEPAERR